MLMADITVADSGWRSLIDHPETLVQTAVQAAWAYPDLSHGQEAEVSILLTDDATVQTLNAQYRGQDKPTNVLAFPADMPVTGGPAPLGDIAIARETVLGEAEAASKPPRDHLAHLAIHGLLHLLGYDHQTDADASHMEGLEVAILKSLDIPDPYEDNAGSDAGR